MTRQEIDAVLNRVRTWPEDRQEDAARLLLAIGDDPDDDPYDLTDEEMLSLDEAEASGIAPADRIDALLSRRAVGR